MTPVGPFSFSAFKFISSHSWQRLRKSVAGSKLQTKGIWKTYSCIPTVWSLLHVKPCSLRATASLNLILYTHTHTHFASKPQFLMIKDLRCLYAGKTHVKPTLVCLKIGYTKSLVYHASNCQTKKCQKLDCTKIVLHVWIKSIQYRWLYACMYRVGNTRMAPCSLHSSPLFERTHMWQRQVSQMAT